MTLLEILVAMIVLLIGIYTVARGFPLLLQSIRGEGDRTTMSRLAEEAMAGLSDNQSGLPESITGGPSVSHYSFAEDMTAPHTELNAQEDIIKVRGETFRVPAPYRSPGGAYLGAPGWYALSQGPASYLPGSYPEVYMLVPLQERFDDPRDSTSVDYGGNWFYVDRSSGQVVIPLTVTTPGNDKLWPATRVVVDYAWTTIGAGGTVPVTHYVQGETPGDVTDFPSSGTARFRECRVHPAHTSSGTPDVNVRLVTGQTRAWARISFGRNVGSATPASGQFTLESKYGATIGFNPADAGLTLKVDYRLRTTQGTDDTFARRLLLMHEEQTIQPASDRMDATNHPYADVRLALKHIDDEPIFTTDVTGAAYAAPQNPVHVLAVDLSTGEVHTAENGSNPFTLSDPNLLPPLENGYADGILSIPLQIGGVQADYVGHVWRFYYRTLERNNIQVQKAPRSYVDADTAQTYVAGYIPATDTTTSLADVAYRTYQLVATVAPGVSDGSQIGTVVFGQPPLVSGVLAEAVNTSGFTVAVNYAYWSDANTRRVVYGELHTVPVEARSVVLNHTTAVNRPFEILAVNGVSARARGWYQTRTGKQKQLDVETVFLTSALGLVPTVR
ncbi:MAG: hypothetical protein WCP21_04270 [Armatimonadota bacterium]